MLGGYWLLTWRMLALWYLGVVELCRDIQSVDVRQFPIFRLMKEENVLAVPLPAHPRTFSELKQAVCEDYGENSFVVELELLRAGL